MLLCKPRQRHVANNAHFFTNTVNSNGGRTLLIMGKDNEYADQMPPLMMMILRNFQAMLLS